jgi:hypothetical protein
MNAEFLMQVLKNEGFAHVYEWKDGPGISYEPHAHKGKVSFYIMDGGVTIELLKTKEKIVLKKGDRYDMLPGILHKARVSGEGCEWVVGEEIEGDA